MDFRRKGKLIAIRKRAKPVAWLAAFLFIYLQTFSVFADDFTVVTGGYESYSCDGSSCTFSGLQDGTIINWNGFNINLGSVLNFFFSTAGGSILNNDISGAASNILGSIFSNGYVFLVNPAGINIGSAASINVAGFLASSLAISNANFLAGNLIFENGAQAGSVINQGTITAQPGGFVALLGGSVANSGSVIADMGSIVFASGEKMTLSFDPNGLINLVIDERLASTITNVEDAILNTGLIRANGGKVILRAEAVGDLFTYLVNNTGIIEAMSVVERNGVIELVANGAISNAGIIRADGSVENSNGGSISVLGDIIEHSGVISANALDFGTAGDIDVVSLYGTYLLSGSVISSRGVGQLSQGGNIYVNALHGSTDFQQDALIDISGGITGNGGTLDLSAFGGDLHVGGVVYQVVADGYTGGLVIFDPDGNITISTNQILAGDILLTSAGGIIINNNVVIQSTGGNITVITDNNHTNDDGVFTMNSGSKLLAFGDITIDGSSAAAATLREVRSTNGQILVGTNRAFDSVTINGGNISVPYLQAPGGITVLANNGISLSNNTNAGVFYEIESTNGNVLLNADADGDGSGLFAMATNTGILAGGDVEIYGSGNTTIRNISATGASSQIIIGTGALTSFNNITLAGLIQGNGGVDIHAFNNLNINNNVQSMAGDISLKAGNNVSIAANQTVQSTGGGNITLLANNDGDASGNFSMANNSSVVTNGGDISISGRGNLTVRTVNAGSGNVSVASTAGSILDDNNDSTRITGNAVTLSAANGIGQATGNNDIDLTANSLTATAANGLIRVTNDQALTINSASSTNGSVTISAAGDLTANSVSASGSGTNNITLSSVSGDVTLGHITGEDTVTVTASSGNILDDGNQATTVSGSVVNMTAAGDIGSSAVNGEIDLDVSAAGIGAFTSTGNGDMFVGNVGGLNVTGSDFVTAGSVTITAGAASSVTNANGYTNFLMTATNGNLTVGSISVSDTISLGALNGSIVDDGNNATSVTANTVNFTAGDAIGTGANQMETNANFINTAAGAGATFVINSNTAVFNGSSAGGDINFTAAAGDLLLGIVSAGLGTINLAATAGNILDAASDVIGSVINFSANLGIGTLSDPINTNADTINAAANNGGVFLTEADGATVHASSGSGGDINIVSTAGDLNVGTITTTGDVSLSALSGNLLGTISDVTGGIVTLLGDSIGALVARINTTAAVINAAANNGGIFLSEGDGATLNNIDASAADGIIDIISITGDLILGSINAGAGTVTLTAMAGDLINDGNTLTKVTGGVLNLIGNAVGSIADQLDTTAGILNVTANAGGIFINETDSVTLDNIDSSAANGDIQVTNASGDMTIQTVNAGTGAVSLTTVSGSILDDFVQATMITASQVSLSAFGSIGSALANGDIDLNINSAGLGLIQSTNGGDIFIRSIGGLDIGAGNFSTTGAVTVTAGGFSSVTGVNGHSDFSLTTTTGDITIGSVSTTNSASFTAQAGNIIDDGNAATKITSNTINFFGGAVGTLADKMNTAADTINAISQTGGIFIMEENGALINADSSLANGTICLITPAGDLILGTINAGDGDVMLEATTGNVLDGNGAANNITAGADSSIVAGGTIGVTGDGIDVNMSNGAILTTLAGGQDGGGTSINIDGNLSGDVVLGTDINFDVGGPSEPSGNVFFNGILIFPIVIPPVTPAAVSGLTGLAGLDLTQFLSPLFPQWSTRRQPALFA